AGIYDGPLAEPSLVLVLVALGVLAWRFFKHISPVASVDRSSKELARAAAPLALAALFAFVVMGFFDARLLLDATRSWPVIHASQTGFVLLLASYLPGISGRVSEKPLWRQIRFALFAILVVACGCEVIAVSPHPHIDVWTTHTNGARAFLHGENPYTTVWTGDTGPGHDPIPYVYPPTTIYAFSVGLFLGDVRYTTLACLVLTGLAMRALARGPRDRAPGKSSFLEDAPALFFWLNPKLFFVLEQCWNDPIPLTLISLAVLAHTRKRAMLTAILLGLAVTAKQSMFWLVPLGGVLLGFRLRQWIAFLAFAVAPELPFVLWNFRALKYANFDFLVGQPPRLDALTPINWLYRHFAIAPSGLPGTLLGASAVGASLLRLKRTAPLFVLAVTLSYFLFFVFNKWAFCNYYFFLAGLASLAAAASIHGQMPVKSAEPSAG
ncbi:MAG: hypothetical protein ABIP89_15700, partial [Polyangiaceae bacterium]